MKFKNSLLVTVPEGHEELEVLILLDITTTMMNLILRMKLKIITLFRFPAEQATALGLPLRLQWFLSTSVKASRTRAKTLYDLQVFSQSES